MADCRRVPGKTCADGLGEVLVIGTRRQFAVIEVSLTSVIALRLGSCSSPDQVRGRLCRNDAQTAMPRHPGKESVDPEAMNGLCVVMAAVPG